MRGQFGDQSILDPEDDVECTERCVRDANEGNEMHSRRRSLLDDQWHGRRYYGGVEYPPSLAALAKPKERGGDCQLDHGEGYHPADVPHWSERQGTRPKPILKAQHQRGATEHDV